MSKKLLSNCQEKKPLYPKHNIFLHVRPVSNKKFKKEENKNTTYVSDLKCPSCGEKDIRSHGYQWRCYVCGRRWVKVKHPREVPIYNQICPYCSETDIMSHGLSWRCKRCGRVWVKKPLKKR